MGRGGYYRHLMVSPANENEVLVAESSFWRSMDGGMTFSIVQWGGDNHDIWWDPTNANHLGLTNDLNARMSWSHGVAWQQTPLPIAQAYHVAIDNQAPYWIYTNRQDTGTMRGSSASSEQPPPIARGSGGVAMSFYGMAAAPGGRGGRGRTGAASDSAASAIARVDTAGVAAARPDTTARANAPAGGGPQFSTWDHNIGGAAARFTPPDAADTAIGLARSYR